MAAVFDIDSLRDARQYLEGAYAPRKDTGEVVYVERIYNKNDRDSIEGLRAICYNGDAPIEIDDPLDVIDFEAVPTLGLVPDGRGAVYTAIDTARQWKKVLTAGRVRVRNVFPHRSMHHRLRMQHAKFMFSPSYKAPSAALEALVAPGNELCVVPMSPNVYVALVNRTRMIGYNASLIGRIDDSGVVHLHPKAAMLRETVADFLPVGDDV